MKLAGADNKANCPCLNEPVMHYIVNKNLLSREVSASSSLCCALCSIIQTEHTNGNWFARLDAGILSLKFGTLLSLIPTGFINISLTKPTT